MTVADPSTSPKTHSRLVKHKLRLTELSVKNAKPEAKAYMIWDAVQRGLGLRVQPIGAKSTGAKSTKSWKCVYSRGGRPRWYHIGNADSISLGDARLQAAEIMVAVAKGKDPAAEKRAERGAGTFAELASKYLEQHAKKKNKSWKQAAALVERFPMPKWGKLQAHNITRFDVKTLMSKIDAPIVANQTLAAISAIFSWGIKEEIVTANPCKLVDRNETRSRERVLSDSELPQFWQAFDNAGLITSTALKTILLTGQRPGEVAHMRREHIVDGGWWQMPGEPVPALGWPGTKNGASHRVWLPAPVQALIAELSDDDKTTGFVFAGTRSNPVGRLDAAMRMICKALGVEPATPHDLRRTHGSTITALGLGREAMNRVQNHKEGGIASVYDRHGYADENKRVMEATAARLLSLAEGRTDSKVVPFVR
jgi:integrase